MEQTGFEWSVCLVCYWDVFLTESWVQSLHMFFIICWVIVFRGVLDRG